MRALESIATPEVTSASVDTRAAVVPGALSANRGFLLYAALGSVVLLPAFLLLVSGLGESRPATAQTGTNTPASTAVARVPAPR